MNALILTARQSGIATMTSREIAELTEKNISHVHRDIVKMLEEVPDDDPERDHVQYDTDARGYMNCVHLPKELSLTLVAGYSIPLRRKIIARWQELETMQAPAMAPALPNFSDPVAAARAWADEAEAKQQAQQALAIAAPRAAFAEAYMEADSGSMSFRQVCKLLGAKEHGFRAFLEGSRIMYRLNGALTAYAPHIEAGRFVVKAGVAGNEHAYTTTKFTAKGVEWVAGEWAKARAREAVGVAA